MSLALIGFGLLKVETSAAIACAGAALVASYGGDPLRIVDCHAGDEPPDGVEVEIEAVPDGALEEP